MIHQYLKTYYDDHPESKYLVKAKVLSVEEKEKCYQNKKIFYCPFTCFCTNEIPEIEDNLLDNNKLNGTITTRIWKVEK